MKKFDFLKRAVLIVAATLLTVAGSVVVVYAQCTYMEDFHGATAGSATFTSNGQSFTVTTNTTPMTNFVFDNYEDGTTYQGWSDAGAAEVYLDDVYSGAGSSGSGGASFTISSTTAFYLKSFWIFCTNDALAYTFASGSTTINVQGLNSSGAVVWTATGIPTGTAAHPGWNPGGSDSTSTLADPYYGWTYVDLSSFGGSNNTNTLIYKFKITTPANSRANYVAFDGMDWSLGVGPTVTTSAATSVGSSTATLNGSVNNSNASTTSYDSFQYSTNSTLSSGVTTVAATTGATATGTSATTIAKSLTGLSGSTMYYFRVKSTNCNGSTYGSITSFTTSSSNTAPTFVSSSPQSLTVCENAAATDITSLLHVSDIDLSQTETWTQASAPSHGTLTFTSATASSGSTNIAPPAGSIKYTPTGGYSGSDAFAIQVSDGIATATMTVNVTVTALPSVSSSGVEICSGSSTGLTATGGTTYTWIPATDLSATTGSSVTVSGLTSTTTYTITGTTSGCSATATVTVTVDGGSVISTTGATTCAGTTATLTATPSSGATIAWYQLSSGDSLMGLGNNFSTPTTISTTTTYYAQALQLNTSTSNSVPPITYATGAGNSNNGVMFDLVPNINTTIYAFRDSVTSQGSTGGTFLIYFYNGALSGHDLSSTGWQLVGTVTSVPSTGWFTFSLNAPVPVVAGRRYAFYITNDGVSGQCVAYYGNGTFISTGTASQTTSDFTVYAGYGKGTPRFTATDFNNRSHYGLIYYSTSCSVGGRSGVTVTVNPLPAAITNNVPLQVNTNLPLGDVTGGGTWTSASTGVATVGTTTGVVNGVTTGTSLVSYTITSSGCRVTATVTVNAASALTWYSATAGGDASVLTNWWSTNSNTGYQPTVFSTTNTTWTFQSNMSSTAALTFAGNVSIVSGGTFAPLSSSTTTVGGNWSNSGGTFTHNNGTVLFNGTTTGMTLSGNMTGTNKFNNVTFNGSGAVWSFGTNSADIYGNYTLTQGKVTGSASVFNLGH